MQPIIVNPASYDCNKAFYDAANQAIEFLTLNNIPLPREITPVYSTTGKWVLKTGMYGLYNPKTETIYVDVLKCRMPGETNKRNKKIVHFPGHVQDQTIYGIVMHEIGHHVQVKKLGASFFKRVQREQFADDMSTFITNPNLLKFSSPKFWKFVTENLQLKPLHDLLWREVLKFASSTIVDECARWIRCSSQESILCI